jgi:hypothetical protein
MVPAVSSGLFAHFFLNPRSHSGTDQDREVRPVPRVNVRFYWQISVGYPKLSGFDAGS